MAIADTISSMYENVGEVYDTITNVDVNTGKNLFDNDNVISNAIIQTSTQKITWTNEATTIWLKVQPNTQYTMSRDRGNRLIIGASNNQPILEGTLDTIIYDGGTSEATSYTFNSGNYTYIAIYISRNTSTTPSWVMINEGTSALPYEPYTDTPTYKNIENIPKVIRNSYLEIMNNGIDKIWNNWEKVTGEGETLTLNSTEEAPMKIDLKGNTSQEGTPTPEAPQDIHVVSGDNTIKVCGKNLFTNIVYKDSYIINSTGGETGNALGCIWKKIEVEPSTTYTLSYSSTDYSFSQRVSEYNSNDTFIQRNLTNNTPYTFTTTANTKYINLSGLKTDTNIQIEKNNQATTYEAYQSQSYSVNLGSIELCKIGDYQDTIVKDNGKWLVNKQIGKVALNGSESWVYDSPRTRFFSTIYSTATMLRGQGFCNYYKYGDSVRRDCFDINTDKKTIYMFAPDSSITTPTTFKTWLGTNLPIVYYVLATPTTTEITDSTLLSQLEAVKRSFNGQTNITQTNNDKPFILDVTALKQLTQ